MWAQVVVFFSLCCSVALLLGRPNYRRAAVSAFPSDVHICPDFGPATNPVGVERGYVDFYVNGTHNIGIELTRDGKELEQHLDRFSPQGIYSPLKLKSWIVVDFRQTRPWPSTVARRPQCIFVVFSKDFATATIKQARTKDEVYHLRA